jgi:putative membrane protein
MAARSNLWKGLAAGAAGGLVASVVMNQFQALLGKWVRGEERSHGAQSLQQGSPDHGIARELKERGKDDEQDDAAMRLANAISEGVFDHELERREKEVAGAAVHYVFGITTGAWYGATVEMIPAGRAGAGLPFGAFVWLTADEGVVPALGLSKAPTEYPPSIHAYALASHFVYGLTTEMVRRAVRRML